MTAAMATRAAITLNTQHADHWTAEVLRGNKHLSAEDSVPEIHLHVAETTSNQQGTAEV